MPFPGYISTVRVHGTFLDMGGDPALGKITFIPSLQRLIDTTSDTVILGSHTTVLLDQNGFFEIELPATDDPHIEDGPFDYQASLYVQRSGTYRIWLTLPAATPDVNISDFMSAGTPFVPMEPPPSGGSGRPAPFMHFQTTASASWIIPHNLAYYPAVSVLLDSGEEVEADVLHSNTNILTISFPSPITGKAVLS